MHKNHILFSYSFDDDGKAKKLDNEEVSRELKSKDLTWVHLDANSKMTKTWLEREVSYLDHLIIDALLAEETRPRIMDIEDGHLIILRGVNLNKNSEPQDMVSIRMWIDNCRIITVQKREFMAVFDICKNLESGKLIKNSGEFLYNLLYQILFSTSPFLRNLNEKLDSLEEKIMTTHDIKFREEILQARTQSTVFKRYLSPQKEVISKLRVSQSSWINDWARRHFQENLDYITHMIEEADEARDKSQILHDELSNALTEKINRNMYRLSLITVIFMPLTFATGLFGMNVGGIPGNENPSAFFICFGGMLLIAMVQILFFKRKDWF